ncbi:MAG: universal stress protein [Deltaproteobacteria bacterium]
MAAWKRIGCAIDFSAGSRIAMKEAIDLARRSGAELDLLHAEEPPGMTDLPPPEAVVEAAHRDESAHLDGWRAEASAELGRPVGGVVFHGPAAPAIARVAAERGIDLLVTGTHGRRGLRHLVLGSVAERLAHLAPCSVLVVRT